MECLVWILVQLAPMIHSYTVHVNLRIPEVPFLMFFCKPDSNAMFEFYFNWYMLSCPISMALVHQKTQVDVNLRIPPFLKCFCKAEKLVIIHSMLCWKSQMN